MINSFANYFSSLSPIAQALIATIFTWGMTALGASMVVFTNTINRKFLDTMLGFAAGVMIAASFWSLLVPSIEMAEHCGLPSWLPASVGFLVGAGFLRLIDRILPHLHFGLKEDHAEGIPTHWRRTTLLILAITLHNIPEGLAMGVSFGALAGGCSSASLWGAIALAIGIGLQNFPEGLAVSFPLRREGFSRLKSIWYGQLSGIVEPIAAVIGAYAVTTMTSLLPYALGFAAGAMIFVVVEEVIPESQSGDHSEWATAGAIIGFVVMMILDVGLGA